MDAMKWLNDPERVLDLIQTYRECDLKSVTLLQTQKLMQDILNHCLNHTLNIGDIPVLRVRKIERDEKHTDRKSVWCPEPQNVIKIGRCNDVNESIFYGSFDPLTAIRECRIQPGDQFTMSSYHLKPCNWTHQSTIPLVRPDLCQHTRDEKIYFRILWEFILVEFTRPVAEGTEYQYKASSALSKILLEPPYKDSLIYPSILEFQSLNLAMKEVAARERLELRNVLEMRLESYDDDGAAYVSQTAEAKAISGSDSLDYEQVSGRDNIKVTRYSFFQGRDHVGELWRTIHQPPHPDNGSQAYIQRMIKQNSAIIGEA